MTPLQTRLHEQVCTPAGLTACLCGAYARVAQHELDAAAKVMEQMNNTLDAARERETRLREALERISERADNFAHAARLPLANLKIHVEGLTDGMNRIKVEADAALSAGAGEK